MDLDTDYEPIPMETYWMIDQNGEPIPVQGCYNGRDWTIIRHGHRRLGFDVFGSESEVYRVLRERKRNDAHR